MTAEAPRSVRSLILPAPGGSLLVPVSVFAELLSYEVPQPLPDTPGWLAGTVEWRGVCLPVLNMAPDVPRADGNLRLAVLWALSDVRADRAYAVLVDGVPVLHSATADTLQPAPGEHAVFVAAHAYANGERVAIPDLDAIESALLANVWGEQVTRKGSAQFASGHAANTPV